MLRRLAAFLLLAWLLGFLWFALALPQPHGRARSDAVVVLTGGAGRIERGLEALRQGWAARLLVSGVDREVRPHEFALEYKVAAATMACCVTLGFDAWDTRSNAAEATAWVRRHKLRSLRLVTSDWHMRRAAYDMKRLLPEDVALIEDAVPTRPSLRILVLEYHKYVARVALGVWKD
jgi:uncharacterized SAM-binding protein YcdF (DUF218 family)